jgi:hypothetical protein
MVMIHGWWRNNEEYSNIEKAVMEYSGFEVRLT